MTLRVNNRSRARPRAALGVSVLALDGALSGQRSGRTIRRSGFRAVGSVAQPTS